MFKAALLSGWHVHAHDYGREMGESSNGELVCVWDNDIKRGEELAKSLGKPFEPDLEKILMDKEIDGVIITTATVEHKEMIIKAANAGKHIFTEKVLGLNVDECREMKEAIEKNGVRFCISFPQRGFINNLFAKKMIDSGKLGEITFLRVRNAHGGAIFGWLPDHFYDDSQSGGGAMLDLGAHPMYLIRWLLGRPTDVVSMFTESMSKGTDDNCVSVFSYENGSIAVSESGFVTPYAPRMLEIYGKKGTLLATDFDVKLFVEGGEWETVDLSGEKPLPLPIEQWISGGVVFDYDAAEGLSEMMEYAYKSYKLGQKVCFSKM